MQVNPGELNRRIKIIKPQSAGKDADGFPIHTEPLEIRNPWAKVTYLSGAEVVKSGSEFSEIKAKFLIRHSKSITIDTSMAILYDGKRFNIEYINDYQQGHVYDEVWGIWKEKSNGNV